MKFLFLILLQISAVFASEALTTNSMDELFKKVSEKTRQYGSENVLIVFDIDNTILTATNDLGSDQWYSWQEKLILDPNCEPMCVTKDAMELINIQGMLFVMNKQRPTEEKLAEKIKWHQGQGYNVILLTSRGHEFRSITEVSLKENGMNFSSSSLSPYSDVAGSYIPYDIENYSRYGLTAQDVEVAGLKAARPVSFQNGIYMTAGQNKGVMLKVLLNRYKKQFKAIIFADDHQRHVDRMQAIMGNISDVTTYRYSKIDPEVKAFNDSDKSEVMMKWTKLKTTLKEIGF